MIETRRRALEGRRPVAFAEREPAPQLDTARAREAQVRQSYRFLVIALFVTYMLFAAALKAWFSVSLTPDLWLIPLLIGAVLLGRAVAFLRDWVPLVFLIFGYEYLRGVAGNIVVGEGISATEHGRVQIQSLIDADKFLFGGAVPTLWLQDHLYDPGVTHWYDLAAVIVYGLHFVFPLVFAFMVWLGSKERFWQFSLAFLAMTYAGFIIFLLFPAAPPWLADQWGYISGVQFPSQQAVNALMPHSVGGVNALKLWTHASPNPVAAMPSLHASFPWLVLLFSVRFFGKKGLVFLAYNAAVWFSIVYLAHHWVVDIIGGILWATLWYGAVLLLW